MLTILLIFQIYHWMVMVQEMYYEVHEVNLLIETPIFN